MWNSCGTAVEGSTECAQRDPGPLASVEGTDLTIHETVASCIA